MRKWMLFLAVAFLATGQTDTAHAAVKDFVGSWENTDRNTRGITRLEITQRGNAVRVRAFASCSPRDCDWGTVAGVAYAAKVEDNLARAARTLTAVFSQSHADTILIIRIAGRQLAVETYTRFKDGGRRSNYARTYTMRRARQVQAQPVPAPAPAPRVAPAREDCIAFDNRRAEVKQARGSWKVVVGTVWLLDFAGNKAQADQALRVIGQYRLSKQCFVGRPKPSMQYYLAGNGAPSGAMRGEDCNAFNPANTKVQKVQGRWKIADGGHWILDFGQNQAEALQAHAIMRKYGFSRICFVGRPNPPMTYFRK